MPTSSIKCCLGLAVLCLAPLVHAQELVRESVPQKWIEQYLPEKLPELKFPAYFDDLDKARAQTFAGRYKAALISLRKVTKGDPGQIALIKATALSATGQREQALATLSAPTVAQLPKAQVLKAQVMLDMGQYPQAIALLKAHLEKNPDSVAGHYYLGQASEQTGDLDTARKSYEWIHKTYYDQWQGQGAKAFDDAETVTLMGRAFDRWAVLNSAYANNPSLNNLILRVFVQAYDVIDRNYWPAHAAAAEYYASHGNSKEAAKELQAALAGNPNDLRCHQLACQLALETFNFDAADQQIEAIRRVDSASPVAELLETRALLAQRRPIEAEQPVQRVLARQPRNIEALGLLASCYALQVREEKVKEALDQVEKLDPNNASAYVDLADQLSAMRQYPRAETMYEKAISRAPWMSEARNGLGLLLTQSGDEDKAKAVLDAAYSLDPFNTRTTNYLILLDKMAKLDRKESAHFVVLYDKQTDPLIPEYFNDYLESVYKSLCGEFRHEPPVKTYIEVFPTHDQFSARITGSPWIGTVGASTGRVIALCTPRPGTGMGTYNWAQVLRHEYTHTITLSATDNRITHWMTEGLAVSEEDAPLRWEWVPMLYNAVTKKQLFSLDNLTWAFVRPRRPQDRSMAYAQSFWICQYIRERWGNDMILKMMAEFRKGRTQDQVFPELLGMSTASFDKDFAAWAEKQVAGWGYDQATSKKYDQLVKDAEAMIKARDFKQAVAAWEQIVKLRPMDMLPHQRLAGLYLTRDCYDPAKAMEHLIRLDKTTTKDNRFAKRIARLCLDTNNAAKAEQFALEAVYIDPYDLPAHELLASVYEKSGNKVGLAREQRVIPILTEWTKEHRKSTLLEGAPQP